MSNCWSCNLPVSGSFCEHCNKLQPVAQKSAFERLGLAVTFDMDLIDLEQKYFSAQRLVHPDRFVGASKTEKIFSAQHSATINEAYGILKDPIKRTQEMLKIAGFIQPNIEQQTLDDPELLMEVIELREELLDVQNVEQMIQLKERLEKLLDENTLAISQAFKIDDFNEASKLLNRLRYLNKIRTEANHRRVA